MIKSRFAWNPEYQRGEDHTVQMVRWKEKVPDPGRLQDSLGAWIVDKWDNRTDLSRRDVFKFIFF